MLTPCSGGCSCPAFGSDVDRGPPDVFEVVSGIVYDIIHTVVKTGWNKGLLARMVGD